MQKKIIGMLGCTALVAVSAWAGASGKAHWEYSGHEGPEHWGALSVDYSVCATGKNQTPINITNAIEADLPTIELSYKAVPLDIINNGHTVQVNYAAGSTIMVGGHSFDLLQFHFHTPSENHIDAKSYPMEAHLVHKDKNGALGVIGVMFEDGTENSFLAKFWEKLPEKAHAHVTDDAIQLNVAEMLPKKQEYYRFNGSLTTPPCSEGVYWMVMKEAVSISQDQKVKIHKIMGDNNRPIQPLNARLLLK